MTNIISDQSIRNSSSMNAQQEKIGGKNERKELQSEQTSDGTVSAAPVISSPSTIVSLSSDEVTPASSAKTDAIKEKHAAYYEASLKVNASPQKIWSILTDVNQWPDWVPGVSSASASQGIKSGSNFVWRQNGFEINSTVGDVISPYKITWDGDAFGTQAHHEWTIIPKSGGPTTVTTAESLDGWLPSLFPGTMQSTLDSSLPKWLHALKARAENAN